MKPPEDDFFIGWSTHTPKPDRRFLLGAAAALLAGAAAAGAGFAQRRPGPSPGRWAQNRMLRVSGVLVETPFPTLLTRTEAGALHPMLLVGYDKRSLPLTGAPPALVTLEGSAISREGLSMLAIRDVAAFARLARPPAPEGAVPPTEDLGEAGVERGEILDAKCWFGAMNPGEGLTHKACAALCARGGLPLAFCGFDACGGAAGELRLFVDADGRPHGRGMLPYLADPVLAEGRLVRRNGLLEFRVAAARVMRI
jgi:hypothetical protein